MGPLALRIALVLLLPACRGVTTSFSYPEDLTHPNYLKRTKAVQRFAELEDREQLPGAFSLLLDENAYIRVVAHSTLRCLTPDGKDYGYRAYLPEPDRIRIAAAWKAWWLSQQGEAAGG